jgi:hypothetical protein
MIVGLAQPVVMGSRSRIDHHPANGVGDHRAMIMVVTGIMIALRMVRHGCLLMHSTRHLGLVHLDMMSGSMRYEMS